MPGKNLCSATAVSIVLIALLVLLPSCKGQHAPAAGEPVDAFTRAVLDSRNAWRGGVVDGVSGTLVGATVADVSHRGSWEAASGGRPVEYKTENGTLVYRAEPVGHADAAGCRKVRERFWKDGGLVRDQVREVCERELHEKRY